METSSFRLAIPDDAKSILEINEAGWLSAYISEEHGVTEEVLKRRFETNRANRIETLATGIAEGRRMILALVDEVPVGYVAPKLEDGKHRVGAIYLKPEAQGQGIGSQLLQEVFNTFSGKDIYLDVVEYNEKARSFYESHGFVYTGLKTSFPPKGEEKAMPMLEMVRRHKTSATEINQQEK